MALATRPDLCDSYPPSFYVDVQVTTNSNKWLHCILRPKKQSWTRMLSHTFSAADADTFHKLQIGFYARYDDEKSFRCCWECRRNQFWLDTSQVARRADEDESVMIGLDMRQYRPLHGKSSEFVDALGCLTMTCNYLKDIIAGRALHLVLDFFIHAPADFEELVKCVKRLGPFKTVAFGAEACFPIVPWDIDSLPRGGRELLRQDMKYFAHELTLSTGANGSHYTRQRVNANPGGQTLPNEIISMIVGYVLAKDQLIPLGRTHTERRLTANRCCGQCRSRPIRFDGECRCNDGKSYSVTCQCVRLNHPIFHIDRAFRSQALRHYYTNNEFIVHGPLGQDHNGERRIVEHIIKQIPRHHLQYMKSLVIDTDWYLHGWSDSQHSNPICDCVSVGQSLRRVLEYLRVYVSRGLSLKIRSSFDQDGVEGSLKQHYIDRIPPYGTLGSFETTGEEYSDQEIGEWFAHVCDQERRFLEDLQSLNMSVSVVVLTRDGSELSLRRF